MTISTIVGRSILTSAAHAVQGLATNRHVGIEVEVEGCDCLEMSDKWAVIGDGSLRNDGAEMVLRRPLAGAALSRAINDLAETFADNPTLDASERTSVHVHVNVLDLSLEQVQNILLVYIATESALYKMGGKSRYDNIYCPGVTSALEQMPLMRKAMSSDNGDFLYACAHWCKYTGINFHSIYERGSIEFRAHEGTTDISRIRNWVNVLLTLVKYAEDTPREKILQDIDRGAMPLLSAVYDTYAPLLARDGDYLRFYKNNVINIVDLLNKDTFKYTHAERQTSTQSGDVAAVAAQLRELVARHRASA